MAIGIFPTHSPRLVDPIESEHHALFTSESFDITCLRLDDTFTAWVNSTWGGMVPVFGGTLSGTTANYTWQFSSDRVTIVADFGGGVFGGDQFTVYITDLVYPGFTRSHYLPNAAVGIFEHYTLWGGAADSNGPAIRNSGPSSISVIPCDRGNPPSKLRYQTQTIFLTDAGQIEFIPTLHLHDPRPPYVWSAKANYNLYEFEFKVTVDGSSAWALMGCTHEGDPMGYAEFDLFDVPSVSVPSPVGIYRRGNSLALESLSDGIVWFGSFLTSDTIQTSASAIATSLALTSATLGGAFPFKAVLKSGEVVNVTAVSGHTATVARAQDGTTAKPVSAGDWIVQKGGIVSVIGQ